MKKSDIKKLMDLSSEMDQKTKSAVESLDRAIELLKSLKTKP